MANDRCQRASSPWHGCALLHAPFIRENHVHNGDKGDKLSAYEIKHKTGKALFPSALSRDSRYFDAKKDNGKISSPRGVLEADLHGLESNPDSIDDATLEVEGRTSRSRALSRCNKFFKLLRAKPFKGSASLPPSRVLETSKGMRRSCSENNLLSNAYKFKFSLVNFTLYDLQNATRNFSYENLIGKGGYAEVYMGCLEDGQLIAVKRLTKGTVDERTAGFLLELGIIAHVDHPNTAKLIGCGFEGGMHLVFELSPNGSLGSILFGSKDKKLDWSKRYKIALGTADGLLYLHENCQRRIIHRDIKADNILLTEDFEPQICDFGLAKWLPREWTHCNVSKFEGTFGYFAPEYLMYGVVDEKTDVYSFGVLLLELITGRRALDDQRQSLVIWAKPLMDDNDFTTLIDPSLGESYDHEEMKRVIFTASSCIEQSPVLRPGMSQIAVLLRGDQYVLECAKAGARSSLERTCSEEFFDSREYDKTNPIEDDKQKQLTLDYCDQEESPKNGDTSATLLDHGFSPSKGCPLGKMANSLLFVRRLILFNAKQKQNSGGALGWLAGSLRALEL